jgi:hypothetical protein
VADQEAVEDGQVVAALVGLEEEVVAVAVQVAAGNFFLSV